MKTSRFTVEQIAQALKWVEGGVVVGEVCRELGITEATFYRWKKKIGGISSPELRELQQLRDEDRRLEAVVADLTLDRTMLQEALRREW
jgi:putative transposase